MMSLLFLAAAQASVAQPSPEQPSSPSEQLKAFRAAWSPAQSPCAQSPAEIALPAVAEKAREVLWARRAELPSYCLMEAAALWSGDDNARAGVLFATGRVRYRYDKARCADPKARNAYDDFHWALTVNFAQVVQAGKTQADTPEAIDARLKRLAEDAATFQIAAPDAQVCEGAGGVIRAASWPAQAAKIREQMTAPR